MSDPQITPMSNTVPDDNIHSRALENAKAFRRGLLEAAEICRQRSRGWRGGYTSSSYAGECLACAAAIERRAKEGE